MTTIELNTTKLQPGLYLIAMPIGNPKDIGLRSIEILLSADIIACEDTRTFQNTMNQVLRHKWNLIAHHKNNESQSADGILGLIKNGKSVCLVSDAGTLNISDPGAKALKKMLENNIYVTSIPGPSALATALSMYPLTSNIQFFGFLPNKANEKKSLFTKIQNSEDSLVFYESPHRLLETLTVAKDNLPGRKVFIGREISKKYEEYIYSTFEDAIEKFTKTSPKGEFVLIFTPSETKADHQQAIHEEITAMLNQGLSNKEILEKIKTKYDVKRNEVYTWIEQLKEDTDIE
ncbi:MAG: 16S rRNA (cytidine(1402)-2'-O)-methyltransferase [Bdellovibrionales bacterium]|nr:16S rRNA (cytidine(1402)-2'-O)-methyltransferase [Bdellovibrionales bacterium]